MENRKKKVAVLMGGVSSEREISLTSGRNVAEALDATGRFDVVQCVLDAESLDSLPPGVDATYIALHGGWGENGGVQAALDALRIPYTGPGAEASRVAMDKVKTKLVLEMGGVPTAPWTLASAGAERCPLALPAVVKPPCEGSSVGVSKVSRPEEWAQALEKALAAQGGKGEVLVEEFVPGREATVAIVGGEALPPVEIVAEGGWYGYGEKYESDRTEYPFVRDAALAERLRTAALAAWKALGCRGVARIDFRVSPVGRLAVLEANTSPGMTSHSLVPKAAAAAGMDMPALCAKVLSLAQYGP